jgi:hypothetical protein
VFIDIWGGRVKERRGSGDGEEAHLNELLVAHSTIFVVVSGFDDLCKVVGRGG